MTKQTQTAVFDARSLGTGKMLTLGLQHMFAMFGATVLVPVITGLSMSATLLFAGLGTLIFHLCTKMKVPAFLGSSFAFLGGYATVVQMGMAGGLTQAQALPYACIGVFCAGLMYFVLAGLFAWFGPKKVMRFFRPSSPVPSSSQSDSPFPARPSPTARRTGGSPCSRSSSSSWPTSGARA